VRIVACLPGLRAFARVLTGERHSADDLVRRTVMREFEPGRPSSAAADQRLSLLTILHELYQGDHAARGASALVYLHNGTQAPARGDASLESSAFQRVFWQLQDDDRKALILTGAAGLSLADAAIVCGCSASTIGLWAMQGRAALLRGLLSVSPAADGGEWRAPTSTVDAASLAVATPWACDGPQRSDG